MVKDVFFKTVKIPDDKKLDNILYHKKLKQILITTILIKKKKLKREKNG